VIRDERVDPRPLEPDRVEHPVLGLGDPYRRVSLPRQGRDRLRHERVELPGDLWGDERVETAGGVEDRNVARHAAVSTGPSRHRRT
jgi:hypothetical protein